jgi:hypothetical protein
MGLVNLISGHVVRAGEDDGIVAVGGEHPINTALPPGAVAGQRVQVAIRPESLASFPRRPRTARAWFRARSPR